MGNISPQEFVTLISKYLDTEKLIRENPSVTKEMIDALLQDIILAKQGKEPTDIHKSHHETTKHKQKDVNDLIIHINGAYRVKSQNILPLYHELTIFLGKIPEWKIQHVRREENACADILANQGIDSSRRQSTA